MIAVVEQAEATIPRLRSIQVGLPRQIGAEGAPDPMDRPWTSGFFKLPIPGPVRLGAYGLEGDGVADRVNHGGRDKAVLLYAAGHYEGWRAELGLDVFPFGAFGENLTVDGQDEGTVCIGDTYAIGPAVVVQVSQPREPCWKLARRWHRKDLPARVVANGRGGWYIRVLEPGAIEPGMDLVLDDRPNPEWTIAAANLVMHHRKRDRDAAAALAACPFLAASWRDELADRAQALTPPGA